MRFATLGVQSFDSDESVSALLMHLSFGSMLDSVRHTESTPPLYYAATWVWTRIFGTSELGLRSLSALAGVVTIPLVYDAASVMISRRVALTAAALATVSPMLVWYSQEARSYSLLVLLVALSLSLFARLQRGASPRLLAGWAAVSALALGVHYFAAFVLAPEALLLLRVRRTRGTAVAIGAVAACGVALLPLAVLQRDNGLAAHLASGDSLQTRTIIVLKRFLVGPPEQYDRIAAAVAAVLALLSVFALVTQGTRVARRAAATLVVVGGSAVLLPVLLALLGLDYVIPRNVIAGVVPLLIAASAGVDALAKRTRTIVTAGACLLLAGAVAAALEPAYQRPDWRGLARALSRPHGTRILVVAPNLDGWSARVPMHLYLHEATPLGRRLVRSHSPFLEILGRRMEATAPLRARVREIDVAAVGWPLPLARRDLPAAFHLAGQRGDAEYRIVVYRSRRAVAVSEASLASRAHGAAILLQAASRGSLAPRRAT